MTSTGFSPQRSSTSSGAYGSTGASASALAAMCVAPAGGDALPIQSLGSFNLEAENSGIDHVDDSVSVGSTSAVAAMYLLQAEVEKDAAQVRLANSRLRLAQAEAEAVADRSRSGHGSHAPFNLSREMDELR